MHETQKQGVAGVTLDDIYLGNGASELIAMATNALLNDGDELLLPAPDYPLWTAVASLSGGKPVHYLCDEANGWMPDLDDIRAKITPRTKGIVVINPNNPTGALYSDELLQEHRRHRARARPGDPGRRGLRQGALRRRQAHRDRQPVEGRADADLQFAVQELPLLRLSRRLAGGLGRQEACAADYIEGLNMLLEHAPVRQRAGPVGDPDRARRLPEHQRPGRARRPPAPAARPGLRAASPRSRA